MKDNHTDITIILDRSGSMESVAPDTIGGFNRFLDDQKAAPGTADITLHQFDTEHETPIPTTNVKNARHLTSRTFVPRGGTALYDAIARGIIATGKRLSSKPDHERASRVVFVIITDGYENSSVEFNSDQVREMIEHQEKTYSWEFVFLGANIRAAETAVGLGMKAANAMTYAHNSQGTQSAFAATSSNLVSMRSMTKADMSYTTQDRDEQVKAGATPDEV